MIPKKTLDRFEIEYEEDNFHIKSWTRVDNSMSNSSGSDGSEGDDSGSGGSDESGSSNEQDISTNS